MQVEIYWHTHCPTWNHVNLRYNTTSLYNTKHTLSPQLHHLQHSFVFTHHCKNLTITSVVICCLHEYYNTSYSRPNIDQIFTTQPDPHRESQSILDNISTTTPPPNFISLYTQLSGHHHTIWCHMSSSRVLQHKLQLTKHHPKSHSAVGRTFLTAIPS